MSSSSSELLNYDSFYRFFLWLLESGLLNELRSQELKVILWVLVNQVSEGQPRVRATISELEQQLAVANKTLRKVLRILAERKILRVAPAKKGEGHRASRPMWLSIDPLVFEHESWPQPNWEEVHSLSEAVSDWLHENQPGKGCPFDGRYVSGI